MLHNYEHDDPAKRFEFREEYWEQALALIEADEARRRKKRRWMLWWGFAGMLLLGAGVGWWCMTSGDRTAAAPDSSMHGKDISITKPQTNNIGGSNTTGNSIAHTSTEGDGIAHTNKDNSGVSVEQPDNQPLVLNKKSAITNPQQKNDLIIDNNSGIKTNNTPSSTGQQQSSEIPKLGTQDKTKAMEQKSPASVLNRDSERFPVGNPEKGSINPVSDQKPSMEEFSANTTLSLEQLLTLPLPFDSVFSTSTSIGNAPEKVDAPQPKQIKPQHDKRFSFGVSAAGVAYRPAPDLRWLGLSGGLWGAYRFSENWSASVGVDMRFQPGSWLDSTATGPIDSRFYSFGFESTVSESRAVGLLSVEIPLAAIWHRGVFSVNAGVAPGRLLYALERFKQTKESSFQQLKTVKNRLERGDTNPYNNFYVNTFAGAEWRFSRNISLTLKGNYRIGPLVKSTPEDPAIKGGSNVALGIRVKLR